MGRQIYKQAQCSLLRAVREVGYFKRNNRNLSKMCIKCLFLLGLQIKDTEGITDEVVRGWSVEDE